MRALPPQVFDKVTKNEFKSQIETLNKTIGAKKEGGKLESVGDTLNAQNMEIIKQSL